MSVASEIARIQNARDSIITAINSKGGSATGHTLSQLASDVSNIPTSTDPEGESLELTDSSSNSLTMSAGGQTVIDPTSGTGCKTTPAVLSDSASATTRGATLSVVQRVGGVDQSLISYLLTTGLLEIRVGLTNALNTTTAGVYTAFDAAMSDTPDIILLQAEFTVTGVAIPKLVSKTASGFYATLGGSTGTGTICEYLAIKFHYVPSDLG